MTGEHEPTLEELLNDLWINPPPHPRSNRTRAAIIDRDARIRAERDEQRLRAGRLERELRDESTRHEIARQAAGSRLAQADKARAERDAAIAERDAARARAERAEAVVVRFPMPSGHMFTYDEQLKMMAEMNGWKARAEKAEAERDAAIAERDEALAESDRGWSRVQVVEWERETAHRRTVEVQAERDAVIAERDTTKDQRSRDVRASLTRLGQVEAERDQAIAERDAARLDQKGAEFEREKALEDARHFRTERDQAIAERDAAISNAKAERERLTTAINDATEAAIQPVAPDRTVPDGWVLVPVEPTLEIIDAIWEMTKSSTLRSVHAWHEAIAVAPKPPAEGM